MCRTAVQGSCAGGTMVRYVLAMWKNSSVRLWTFSSAARRASDASRRTASSFVASICTVQEVSTDNRTC